MNLSEQLTRGNWLYYRGRWNAFPFQVEQVTRKKVGYHAEPGDKRMYYLRLNEEVKPIPLTAELLEKNGFKRGIDRGWGNDIREVYCLTFDVDVTYQGRTETFTHEIEAQHKVSSDLWDVETTNGSRIFNLEYLHQLQNALRLCGIKREIIAF